MSSQGSSPHRQPPRAGQRDRGQAESHDEPADDADTHAVAVLHAAPGTDAAAPPRVGDAFAQATDLVGVIAGAPLLRGLPRSPVVRGLRRCRGLLIAQLVTCPVATISVGADGAS